MTDDYDDEEYEISRLDVLRANKATLAGHTMLSLGAPSFVYGMLTGDPAVVAGSGAAIIGGAVANALTGSGKMTYRRLYDMNERLAEADDKELQLENMYRVYDDKPYCTSCAVKQVAAIHDMDEEYRKIKEEYEG